MACSSSRTGKQRLPESYRRRIYGPRAVRSRERQRESSGYVGKVGKPSRRQGEPDGNRYRDFAKILVPQPPKARRLRLVWRGRCRVNLVSLDRKAQRVHESRSGEVTLEEIVLCSLPDRPNRQFFIVDAA